MAEPILLTRVEIVFLPEFVNHWLRFGQADEWQDLDRRRAFAYFRPGRVFGYVRWEASEYGTQAWRLFVVRSGGAAFPLDRVPGITPGGELLLDADGAAAVKRALAAIDAIEALGIDPADVSPVYFLHVHNRLRSRLPVRPYTSERHAAHVAARAVRP